MTWHRSLFVNDFTGCSDITSSFTVVVALWLPLCEHVSSYHAPDTSTGSLNVMEILLSTGTSTASLAGTLLRIVGAPFESQLFFFFGVDSNAW
jgi:hypothetical protein